uniref:Homeobox and leucine zipper encoding n=1 Tax=Sphenodon punctatus TaxID=8508 RepID=A0A8D0G4J7_SPHPU
MPPNKDVPGCSGSAAALICLPPISEDLQLVWTQAAQTSDLDSNQHLLRTFSYFPYPSLADLALLCLRHGLPMEKVKAWFMAQRLRCGISWSVEEIEETRARLSYHHDRLCFGGLLFGAEGGSMHQLGKGQETREPVPAPMHQLSKGQEFREAAPASMHQFGKGQETQGPRFNPRYRTQSNIQTSLNQFSEPGRSWELKTNQVPCYNKAQANEGASLHHHFKTEEPPSPPSCHGWMDPNTSFDYHLQSLNAVAWELTKPLRRVSEPPVLAANGSRHLEMPLLASSTNRAAPSSSRGNSAMLYGHRSHPFPVGIQRHVEGGFPDAQRQRKVRRKTKEQLDMLKSFFLRCQWARREDYQWLEELTGLPRSEIIQWFGDTRYALKHGQLRWFRDNPAAKLEPAPSPPLSVLPPAVQMDTRPLERYWAAHQQLREGDLPALCRASGMGNQQVLNWFYSRSPEPYEVEVCLGEEDEDEDEEAAAAAAMEEEGEEEEDEEEEDDDRVTQH